MSNILPIRAAPPGTPSGVPTSPGDANSLKGLRVLLVEDDADSRELVSAILVEAGAEVQSEASAARAFDAICWFHPQLLVSDIGMPDEDGYSLVRRIRALESTRGGRIPCLALTAFTRAEDRKKALAAGFTMHISKPINVTDLVATVGQLAALAAH